MKVDQLNLGVPDNKPNMDAERGKFYFRSGSDSAVPSGIATDDTPVDGATAAPISSNWAYDHVQEQEEKEFLYKEILARLVRALIALDVPIEEDIVELLEKLEVEL